MLSANNLSTTTSRLIRNAAGCPQDPNHMTLRALLSVPGLGIQSAGYPGRGRPLARCQGSGRTPCLFRRGTSDETERQIQTSSHAPASQRSRPRSLLPLGSCLCPARRPDPFKVSAAPRRRPQPCSWLRGVCDRLLSVLISMRARTRFMIPGTRAAGRWYGGSRPQTATTSLRTV